MMLDGRLVSGRDCLWTNLAYQRDCLLPSASSLYKLVTAQTFLTLLRLHWVGMSVVLVPSCLPSGSLLPPFSWRTYFYLEFWK